ncbi:MerR family transcriptional regulator [Pseudovibrio japonicus]|uniref:MerR family transcriptional regulator n=1 Tax=Pseudovibrio japonicus TaxID=366534 RepID=A0ABQ3E5U1_9HYPH|nr:helix-turn-helix domain-containing protein [Pseudovibrio japonicus]GHB22049.1 MerR family transcriptional regulator [Pseudovibrio japonicus]
MAGEYSIGDLAVKAGVKVQTIRFYEQKKLLPEPPRTGGGQRRYSEEHLNRLSFIRHGRDLGFSLEMIESLMLLKEHPEDDCAGADQIARAHLAQVEDKILRLKSLQTELKKMLVHCSSGKIHDCRVIEALSCDCYQHRKK